MIINLWRQVKAIQQNLDKSNTYIASLRLHIQADINAYLVIQRELSFAHAALRRKNKQLKHLKAMVEYLRSHPPQSTR